MTAPCSARMPHSSLIEARRRLVARSPVPVPVLAVSPGVIQSPAVDIVPTLSESLLPPPTLAHQSCFLTAPTRGTVVSQKTAKTGKNICVSPTAVVVTAPVSASTPVIGATAVLQSHTNAAGVVVKQKSSSGKHPAAAPSARRRPQAGERTRLSLFRRGGHVPSLAAFPSLLNCATSRSLFMFHFIHSPMPLLDLFIFLHLTASSAPLLGDTPSCSYCDGMSRRYLSGQVFLPSAPSPYRFFVLTRPLSILCPCLRGPSPRWTSTQCRRVCPYSWLVVRSGCIS
ncbi:hypothetical protein B0H12DRAFT_1120853 [Mycena haematopus]|nr:hypothetical protein B0H12DRAFT_1120853 [Mycena haematopus]